MATRPPLDVGSLESLAYCELHLDEVRAAGLQAFRDGSWQAYATLKRQEREAYQAVHAAREAEKAADTAGAVLTDEEIIDQQVLPFIQALPLPIAYQLYQALGARLGQAPSTEDLDEGAG